MEAEQSRCREVVVEGALADGAATPFWTGVVIVVGGFALELSGGAPASGWTSCLEASESRFLLEQPLRKSAAALPPIIQIRGNTGDLVSPEPRFSNRNKKTKVA